MMPRYRRHALLLMLVLGLSALLAQLAGVGATRGPATRAAKPTLKTLTTIPGGSVPDVGSTQLSARAKRARAGEVVQMRGDVTLAARRVARGGVAQVVCGLRYSRDRDASWTLGTPYEAVVLTKTGARRRLRIERSFTAPASDVYRVAVACHVSAPERGAKVRASGATRLALGLPDGAAIPVE